MSESQSKDKLWCGSVPSAQAIKRATQIRLLLMDVDGVLTDGKVYYVPTALDQAYETKGIDSHDGLAFHMLRDAGIETGFISGRNSPAVVERAANMHVKYVRQGNLEKQKNYEDILHLAKVQENEVAYIGDDLPDIPLLKRVGLACAVANAREEAKLAAHFVSHAAGGKGAMREISELILKAQNKWIAVLQKYNAQA